MISNSFSSSGVQKGKAQERPIRVDGLGGIITNLASNLYRRMYPYPSFHGGKWDDIFLISAKAARSKKGWPEDFEIEAA